MQNIDSKRKVLADIVPLLLKKNEAYGSENIIVTGVNGVLVRIVDKCYRAYNLSSNKEINHYESLKDTFMDIIGYSIICIAVLDGKWGPSGPELKSYLNGAVKSIPIGSPEFVQVSMVEAMKRESVYVYQSLQRMNDAMSLMPFLTYTMNFLINASLVEIEKLHG